MFHITHENASEVFRRNANAVYRVALGIVRSPEEAEDILMECFSKALGQEYNDEKHLKYWLMRMAEHRALNVVKSARIKRSVPLEEAPTATEQTQSGINELLDTVMRLPEIIRTVIYMFYYEDMPAADIAQALAISENTVYKRLARGRKLLKLTLEEELQ